MNKTVKRKCYCLGITRKDGSKILCVNCEHTRIEKILEEHKESMSNRMIKDVFLELVAYEDYSFAENDGYIDHESISCKMCYLLIDSRKEGVEHFRKNHL